MPAAAALLIAFCCSLMLIIPGPAVVGREAQASGQASSSLASNQEEARLLEPSQAVRREIAKDHPHAYWLDLAANQYLRVSADDRALRVGLAVFDPAGSKLIEADGYDFVGTAQVEIISATAGRYLLRLSSKAEDEVARPYEIRIEERRTATAPDQTRIAWQRAFFDGGAFSSKNAPDARRQAVEKYQEALTLAREMQDRTREGEALIQLGHRFMSQPLNDDQQALACFAQAREIFQATGDGYREGRALFGLAYLKSKSGELRQASESYQQLLPLAHSVKHVYLEASALQNLGSIHQQLGEYHQAIAYSLQAASLYQSRGNSSAVTSALRNLGQEYTAIGESRLALDAARQVAQLSQAAKLDLPGQVLIDYGLLYYSLSEWQSAREYFGRAQTVCHQQNWPGGEGLALTGLGTAYAELGETERALAAYDQALTLLRAVGYRPWEGMALGAKGMLYDSLGDKPQALKLLTEAVPLLHDGRDQILECVGLNALGGVKAALGQREEAQAHYQEALAVSRRLGELNHEAVALYGLARLDLDQGVFDAARIKIEEAVKLIESRRLKIPGYALRSSYFASVGKVYDFYLDLLMRLHERRPQEGFAALALETSERARARSLLEMLNETRADIREGVDAKLLERERILQQTLNAKTVERIKTPALFQAQAEQLKKEIDALTVEYQQVQTQIRAASPRYAALTQPQPLSLKEIQQEVLDANTLLLEYALGDERSFLFAATPNSLNVYQLPKRAEIEIGARNVYALLTARYPVAGESEAQWQQRVVTADAKYWPAAAALSQMLLAPVASQLGNKRLAIVAAGQLQYIPFGALPVPQTQGSANKTQSNGQRTTNNGQPLIASHEIINLPSASTLAVQRRLLAGRQAAGKTLAVLADPVFEKNDPRIKRSLGISGQSSAVSGKHEEPEAKEQLLRAARDVSAGTDESPFARLLYSRTEANKILALVDAPEQRLGALDFAANRETAIGLELGKYRYLHFATHGLLDEIHPELSGIVLSLLDEQGQPRDGFLKLSEIYNLKLSAELVVLSACQTALGKQDKAEGLVGLTRGFMYAGAPRVVASLWKVQDDATAELMTNFYRAMLREGKRPAEALRAAQVAMLGKRNWQSPFYWAAFVLQGEWR